MIRFACPGCSATYTVGDEKGGKSGKCPKCQAQFTIPMPDASASVPVSTPSAPTLPSTRSQVPPPPPPADGPVEIAPCPGCRATLSVERGDLGSDVECPYCKTVFKAKMPGSEASGSGTTGSGSSRRPARQDDDDLDVVPAGRSLRDEDEDDRPSRRSRMRDEDDEDERPSRRGRRTDDDDEDDRPRRRRRRSGAKNDNPIFGILSLVGGILGILSSCCCLPVALVFDLAAIVLGIIGIVKGSGKGMSIGGLACGIVGLILLVVFLVIGLSGNALQQIQQRQNQQQQNQRFR